LIFNKIIQLLLFFTVLICFNSFATAQEKEKVTLQLKWLHSFQFAGYYAAIEKGFYAEENLDVTLLERNFDNNVSNEVLAGRADYGIGSTGLLLASLKNNNDFLLVAQIFQHSPLVILTRKEDKLLTPFDLKGKKVTLEKSNIGITDTPALALIYDSLGSFDQVDIQPHTFRIEDLIEGKTDALTAYISDQPFSFKQKDIAINIIHPRDYGIDFYGDNLFTRKSELQNHPSRVERMRKASLKGWKYALDHPKEIIDLILKKYNSQNLSRAHLKYEAQETAKMIVADFIELGSFEKTRYKKIIETYAQLGITDNINLDHDFFLRPTLSNLNAEERRWLANHPRIEVGTMQAWPPFDFVNTKNQASGIGAGVIKALNKYLGGVLVAVPGKWEDIFNSVKNKQRPALMDITPKPEREADFNFTTPYLSITHAIIGRRGETYYKNAQELTGKTIALEQGFGNNAYFNKNHPKVSIKQYPNTTQALDAVARGEIDAYVGNRAVANYLIRNKVFLNLETQGSLNRKSTDLTMGIRKDWPILRDILQKALDSLTEIEINNIINPWVSKEHFKSKNNLLTQEEQDWLIDHQTIKVAMDPDWAPIEYISNTGDFDGISMDYLKIISKDLGIRFEAAKNISWQQAVSGIKNKQLDIFSSVSQTAAREEFSLFTKPYISFPIKIYANKKTSYIGNVENLSSKKIAIVKGYAVESWLKRDHPDLILIPVKTPLDGLRMVSENEVDVFIGNAVSVTYYLGKYAIDNVRVAGDTPYSNDQSMAVRNDWPILASILQKSLDNISDNQHALIFNSWMSIKFEHAVNYQLIWKIVLGSLFLLLIIIYWNRRLSQEINRRKRVENKLLEYQLSLEQRVIDRTKEYTHLAHHDALTGLPNRIFFADRLTQAIKTAERHKSKVAVFFIDLDDFKQVNDSFDHSSGDITLQTVASRFKALIRKEDTLARMGGDEFTLILNDFNHESDLALIANKIIQLFKEPFLVQGHNIFLGASIGISIYPQHGTTIEDLVRNADSAMYKAKYEGRNQFKYYSELLTEQARERIILEANLRKALDKQEFVVYYQPQLELNTGKLSGLEALVRWLHPEKGLIPPNVFIPLAERSRLIIPLGEWILKESCKQMHQWQKSGLIQADISISVNLSPVQFDQEGLIKMIDSVIKSTELPLSNLELEITESTMMKNQKKSTETLKQLRSVGVKLAIDDFGTGYSSLNHLKHLPVTKLKIDQSFVSNIPNDAKDIAIAKTVIDLAQGLSLDVLAEGIETEDQLDFLKHEGCSYGQGYLFAKPLPAKDFESFLNSFPII